MCSHPHYSGPGWTGAESWLRGHTEFGPRAVLKLSLSRDPGAVRGLTVGMSPAGRTSTPGC